MTKRNQLIILAAVGVVLIGGVITAALLANRQQPTPVQNPGTIQPEPAEPEQPGEDPEDHHVHTDAEGEDFSEETLASMTLNARQAIQEYVLQPRDETAQERQLRISPYLAPGSPVLKAKPPFTTEGYSTSGVKILETSWVEPQRIGEVAVIVYITIVVDNGFNNETQNQTWIADLREQPNGSWLTYTIRKSNRAYIEGTE